MDPKILKMLRELLALQTAYNRAAKAREACLLLSMHNEADALGAKMTVIRADIKQNPLYIAAGNILKLHEPDPDEHHSMKMQGI